VLAFRQGILDVEMDRFQILGAQGVDTPVLGAHPRPSGVTAQTLAVETEFPGLSAAVLARPSAAARLDKCVEAVRRAAEIALSRRGSSGTEVTHGGTAAEVAELNARYFDSVKACIALTAARDRLQRRSEETLDAIRFSPTMITLLVIKTNNSLISLILLLYSEAKSLRTRLRQAKMIQRFHSSSSCLKSTK